MSEVRPLVRPSGDVRNLQEDTDILIAKHLEPSTTPDSVNRDMFIGTTFTEGKKITLGTPTTNVEIPGILTVYDVEIGGVPGSLTLGDGDGDVITLGGAYVTAVDTVNLGTADPYGDTILNLRVRMVGDVNAGIQLDRTPSTNAYMILPSTADNPAGLAQVGMIRVNNSGELEWFDGSVWQDTTDISRILAVLDYVDNTAVPPTEVTGDRYILDFTAGVVDPAWDGALVGDIVVFDGASWVAQTPAQGWIAYVIAESQDRIYLDGPPPDWEARPPEVAIMVPGIGSISTIRLNSNCTAAAPFAFSVGELNVIGITGQHSAVFGRENSVDGYDCVVGGYSTSVESGSHSNAAFGYSHTLSGGSTHNIVSGFTNDVIGSFQNSVSGFNQSLTTSMLSSVMGSSNTVEMSVSISISGSGNTITSCNGLVLGGNNNTATDVDYSLVQGDDITLLAMLNSIVIGTDHLMLASDSLDNAAVFGSGHAFNSVDSGDNCIISGFNHSFTDSNKYGAFFGYSHIIEDSWNLLVGGASHNISESAASIVGGSNNTLLNNSGTCVIGGASSIIDNSYGSAVFGGSHHLINSPQSLVEGYDVTLTNSEKTLAIGYDITVTGAGYCVAFGDSIEVTKPLGLTTGNYALNEHRAVQVNSGGKPAATVAEGVAQNIDMIPHTGQTDDDVLTEIFMNGYAATERFAIPSGSTYFLTMQVLAKCYSSTATYQGKKCWEYSILIDDNASGGIEITSFHKTVVHKTKIGYEKEWDVVLSTDGDNLVVKVQGSTTTEEDIRWQCHSQGPMMQYVVS